MSIPQVDEARYRDAVRGCWLGKNVGGTLGAPFEGSTEINDVPFYVQENLNGRPVPNDDLDLQLVWLTLAEYHGPYALTPQLFGEAWLHAVTGPWNEYAVCRWNCQCGFFPPLSGAVDNDLWKWSNGAWIRSEIWACLFPGEPDRAITFAHLDASCDHSGEGVYAEMFTAALEAAAFVEKDLAKLIEIALAKVPEDSRLSRSVRLAAECFQNGEPWLDARRKIVEMNADLGWFQAPANVAFTVLALLYGEGDFGRTVTLAVNCGDDTDCTAATAGAVLGILLGASGLPERWTAPIGDEIVTGAIDPFALPVPAPKTVTELTRRVVNLRERLKLSHPRVDESPLDDPRAAQALWSLNPFRQSYPFSFAEIEVEYLETPLIEPGKSCPIRLWVRTPSGSMPLFRFRWILPEGWHSRFPEVAAAVVEFHESCADTEVTPPEEIPGLMTYLTLEIRRSRCDAPTLVLVPFRRKGAEHHPIFGPLNLSHHVPQKRMTEAAGKLELGQ